jgi:hypothetical protein
MKTSIDKTKASAVVAIVLLMASVTLMAMPVQAQYKNPQPNGSIPLPAGVTPDISFQPRLGLSFRPNPVGVGQTVLVNMWMEPPTAVTRYITGYTVTITKPDKTTEVKVLNSYQADTTAWFEFVPDQVGNWTLKFEMPGAYFPPGNYTMPADSAEPGYTESYTRSLYYEPCSTGEQTLVVQQAQIVSWPPSPLPTDYWTRPVSPDNREWWSILGDYPWYGPGGGTNWPANTNTYWSASYSFIPYVQAPNTAHIVWSRQGAISGLMGGDNGIISQQSGGGTPNIIYQGRCYQTLTKPMPTTVNGTVKVQPMSTWECYDLRTGEVYWDLTGVTAPSIIEYSPSVAAVPGAEAATGMTVSLVAISRNRLIKYNPYTGAVTMNISIPSFSTTTYYMNQWAMSVQTLNTKLPYLTPGNYRLINWTTAGTSTNFTSRIASNITWPRPDLGLTAFQDWSTGLSFQAREPNTPDPAGGFPFVNIYYDNATGFRYGTLMLARSMKTGATLWNFTLDFNETSYSPSCGIADHGKVAVVMRDGTLMCWDEYTGKLLWQSEKMDYPWSSFGFGAYAIASAYGLVYRNSYDGVYAFNWTNGKIVWHYEAPTPDQYETPYIDNGVDVYSFNGGSQIADGKLYTYNTEHTPTEPITRGWSLHCINATTGKGIWNITGSMSPGPIADGYLTASNSYDGYMYVFGKGQSATTVSASPAVIAQGATVLIQGTVLDQSPAEPGTPCVSAASMATQMEYLHMQAPINGLWNNVTMTGVPVILTATGSDGTVYDIGTATTDAYHGTFICAWTPPKADTYAITALFAGDDSYGSSSSAGGLVVSPAPSATPTPTPPAAQPATDYMPYIIGMGIAIIIAVAIATILILRKRP